MERQKRPAVAAAGGATEPTEPMGVHSNRRQLRASEMRSHYCTATLSVGPGRFFSGCIIHLMINSSMNE